MALRVLTLVLMVLLLALPHSGNRVLAAGLSQDQAGDHAHHLGVKQTAPGAAQVTGHGAGHGVGQGNPACIPICIGAPLTEAHGIPLPGVKLVALWAGFGGPLSRALAAPATPSRPPNGGDQV